MMKKILRRLTPTQMILIGFCMVEVIGTLLLMLPVSTREGIVTPPVNALFTAVSASCVTGLVRIRTMCDSVSDPDRRPGIYDDRSLFCHCSEEKDWPVGAGNPAGEC